MKRRRRCSWCRGKIPARRFRFCCENCGQKWWAHDFARRLKVRRRAESRRRRRQPCKVCKGPVGGTGLGHPRTYCLSCSAEVIRLRHREYMARARRAA